MERTERAKSSRGGNDAPASSDDLFAAIFHAAAGPIALTSIEDGRVIDANEPFAQMIGRPLEQVIGATAEELDYWADPEDRDELARRLRSEGSVTDAEARFRRGDGAIRVGQYSCRIVQIDGQPCILTTTRDLTEDREAQDALRQAEIRYRTLVEHVPAMTYVWDSTSEAGSVRTRYLSPQIETLMGYTVDEWLGTANIWELRVHPDDRERILECWNTARDTKSGFSEEYRLFRKDGREIWVRDEARQTGYDEEGFPLWQGVMFDITERKHAEQALAASEARLKVLVDNVPGILWTTDTELNITSSEGGALSIFGLEPGQAIGRNIRDTAGLENDQESMPLKTHRLALQGTPSRYDITFNGRRWDSYIEPLRDDDDTIVGTVGVTIDVTDRLNTEEELRESERKFRTLVEEIPAITYIEDWDHGGPGNPLRYLSPQVEEVWGVTVEERLNDPMMWAEMLHPDDRDRVLEEDKSSNVSGELFDIDYRLIRPDGGVVWIHEHTRLVYDTEGHPDFWLGVMFDVTQQKTAEQALQTQAHQLRSISEIDRAILSASAAEDIIPVAIDRVRELIDCDLVGAAFLDEDRSGWHIVAMSPTGMHGLEVGAPVPTDILPIEDSYLRGEVQYLPELEGVEDLSPFFAALREQGGRSILFIPLVADGELIGAFGAESFAPDAFDERDRQIARDIAGQIAIVYQQARLHEQVEDYTSELEERLTELRRSDEQRRQLLARLVRAQEEERRRIASDIHDDSIQKMAAIGLRLETLRRKVSDPEALDTLGQIEETVQSSIERLRHLMFELWPPALDRHGLAVAVRTELEQTQRADGLDFVLDDEALTDEPPVETRTIAYRIIQEAVANVRKHAGASRVSVTIATEREGTRIRIADDGKGLDVSESPPGHLGLHAMRERAAMAGGTLEIHGSASGTVIDLWLPSGQG